MTKNYDEDIGQWKRQEFGEGPELPVPADDELKLENMLSGAVLLGASPFGSIQGNVIKEGGNADSSENKSASKEDNKENEELAAS